MNKTLVYGGAAVLALALGAGSALLWKGRTHAEPVDVPPPPAVAAAAPGLWQSSFADLQGKPQAFQQWRGKPLVVNFWATWCAPCREEIPEFIATQHAHGDKVRFVGLAIDNPNDVAKFVTEFKIDYPVLTGEQEALELMRTEGNRLGALPFTLIYDARGNKVATHAGRLDQAKLDNYLKPLLAK